MEVFQVIAFGIIAAIMSVILKKNKPEISLLISIAAGVIIFAIMTAKLTGVLGLLNNITQKVSIDTVYMVAILKIIAIAYIAQFGSEVCKDAGESTIALKLEFAGKIMIIILAAPIIYALLDLIVKIIP